MYVDRIRTDTRKCAGTLDAFTLVVIGGVIVLVGGLSYVIYFQWSRAHKVGNGLYSLSEVEKDKAPTNVEYEIYRDKGGRTVIIKSGKVSKRKTWIDFKIQGVWRRYFPNHILKETDDKGKERYVVRLNVFFSEALHLGHLGIPKYDQALENQLMNEWHSQYKKAIGAVSGLLSSLVRDSSIQFLLLMAFGLGIPIGMGLWPQFFPQSQTVVHWVQR